MEVRGRRIVLVTNTPLPAPTSDALAESVKHSTVIIATDGSIRRSLQPAIVRLMIKPLYPADFDEICARSYLAFDNNLPDFAVKIDLSWDDAYKKPAVTVYQTNRPDYSGGKFVLGHFTLCGLFGDRNDHLEQLKHDPFGTVTALCDQLPQEVGDNLTKLFRTNFFVRNGQLEPV